MATRIISGVIGLLILLAVVYYGGMALFAAALFIACIGLFEFYHAMEEKELVPISLVGYLAAVGIFFSYYFPDFPLDITLILILSFMALSIILLVQPKYTLTDGAVTLYGILYIPLLLGHVLLIDQQPHSVGIWLIFITAWGTDTCAYFVGSFFGKRKLCPGISPKKTVEGAIGGIIGCMILSGIFGYLFMKEYLVYTLFIGLLGSILSMAGDLTASVIKRQVGIKDFSNLIPGHGGVLDRFDSVLFTAPVVFYILRLIA